jgi:hypothetical protein
VTEGQTPASCVESALCDVLRCLSFLALVSVSLPMSAFHRSDGRAWFLPSTAAWSQHTRRLCKLFKGAIRSGAAAVPAWSPAGPMLSMLLSMSAQGAMCLPEPIGVGAHLQAALATQPGSRQQRQLVSSLLTGLKVAAMLPASQYFEAQDVRIAAALGAAAAMHRLTAAAAGEESAVHVIISGGGCNGNSNGGGTTSSGAKSGAGVQSASQALLSWLVLFGRCCLQWAQLLPQEQGQGGLEGRSPHSPSSSGAHYFGRLGLRRTADIFLLQLSGVFMQPAISGLSPSPSLWSLMYKACLLCLQNGDRIMSWQISCRWRELTRVPCWICCVTHQTGYRTSGRPTGCLGWLLGRAGALGC